MHYWFALVLLGIGWNFLFVAGTSQRVQTYRPSERFRAQAAVMSQRLIESSAYDGAVNNGSTIEMLFHATR